MKDHILRVFKDFGLVEKTYMKNIFPILAQGSLMDQGYSRAMTIFCLIVLVMDISADSGNGQMVNHGITLTGTMVNHLMKDQMIV